MLEKLMLMSKEELKSYIDNLSDSDRLKLLSEIEEHRKSTEADIIRLETQKTALDNEEKEIMKELAEYGIHDYASLDAEINKLSDEINQEIEKYVEALKGE